MITACMVTPDLANDGEKPHGRHAHGATPIRWSVDGAGMSAIEWRQPRTDDPVERVIDASCPHDTQRWQLCHTRYGSYLVRFIETTGDGTRVWESRRREDDIEPIRDLFERIMTGKCR
jgi:hypothetical protein